jgi:hypothetical protein
MGKSSDGVIYKPFTNETIKNKQLMLDMLHFEDQYYFSDVGQNIMADIGKNNLFSLDGGKTIQRITLHQFGFSSTDQDLAIYRTIFHNYYNSSTDYDSDILSSVYYMRENRLLYYTTPKLSIGDKAIDSKLLELHPGMEKQTKLYNILSEEPTRKHVLCAFSLS